MPRSNDVNDAWGGPTQPEQSHRSLFAIGTSTNRVQEADNEDSIRIAENQSLGLRAIIVADGVGSFTYSRHAAEFATQNLKEQIEQLISPDEVDIGRIFLQAQAALRQFAMEFAHKSTTPIDLTRCFATTLIMALEDQDRLRFAYLGNGAIWHIRGNFNHFSSVRYLPWNSLNYLNPHTIESQGREALYKMLAPTASDDDQTPTVMEIVKDHAFFGDLFMICTDGIYSFDQVPIGKESNGKIWISGEEKMAEFYQALTSYFAQSADPTEDSLEEVVSRYLRSLRESKSLEDDATVGIIVTSKCLEYQRKNLVGKPKDHSDANTPDNKRQE